MSSLNLHYDSVAAFDRQRRDEAARAGRPIQRRSCRLITVDHDAAIHPSTATQVCQAFDAGVVVVPDGETAERTVRLVRKDAAKSIDRDKAVVSRQLAAARTFPISSRLVVLTEVLSEMFWLPRGRNAGDINEWADAFGIRPGGDMLDQLYRKAGLDGVDSPDAGTGAAKLAKYENCALEDARLSNLAAACRAYKKIGNVGEFFDVMAAKDPALTERNIIAGRISTVRTIAYGDGVYRCVVSTPFKQRTGSRVVVWDAEAGHPGYKSGTPAQLSGTSLNAAGELVAHFDAPRQNGLFERRGTVVVAPQPFIMAGGKGDASIWTKAITGRNGDGRKAVRREVDLEVILAGSESRADD